VALSGQTEASPENLQIFAERRLKTLISDGTLKPLTKLSPNLLAPELGLSHIPIREALASLAAAGFVTYAPRRGYLVRELTSEDLADIYHWRQVLESEAYRSGVPKMTDSDLTEMQRLIEEMSQRTASADRIEYVKLNREFHFVPFKRAGSERLIRFLNLLWDSAAPYKTLNLPNSALGNRDHIAMMKHFEARDIDAVIAAADKHRGDRMTRVAQWEAAQMEGEGTAGTTAVRRKNRKR
jgi:DNA-binding GntR family transcriptional regulator